MNDLDGGLRGGVAVVTGAGRRGGMGTEICRALARLGADVLFTHWRPYDRAVGVGEDPEGPGALLAELRVLGRSAAAMAADLALPDAPGAYWPRPKRGWARRRSS